MNVLSFWILITIIKQNEYIICSAKVREAHSQSVDLFNKRSYQQFKEDDSSTNKEEDFTKSKVKYIIYRPLVRIKVRTSFEKMLEKMSNYPNFTQTEPPLEITTMLKKKHSPTTTATTTTPCPTTISQTYTTSLPIETTTYTAELDLMNHLKKSKLVNVTSDIVLEHLQEPMKHDEPVIVGRSARDLREHDIIPRKDVFATKNIEVREDKKFFFEEKPHLKQRSAKRFKRFEDVLLINLRDDINISKEPNQTQPSTVKPIRQVFFHIRTPTIIRHFSYKKREDQLDKIVKKRDIDDNQSVLTNDFIPIKNVDFNSLNFRNIEPLREYTRQADNNEEEKYYQKRKNLYSSGVHEWSSSLVNRNQKNIPKIEKNKNKNEKELRHEIRVDETRNKVNEKIGDKIINKNRMAGHFYENKIFNNDSTKNKESFNNNGNNIEDFHSMSASANKNHDKKREDLIVEEIKLDEKSSKEKEVTEDLQKPQEKMLGKGSFDNDKWIPENSLTMNESRSSSNYSKFQNIKITNLESYYSSTEGYEENKTTSSEDYLKLDSALDQPKFGYILKKGDILVMQLKYNDKYFRIKASKAPKPMNCKMNGTYYEGKLVDDPNSIVKGFVHNGLFSGTIENANGTFIVKATQKAPLLTISRETLFMMSQGLFNILENVEVRETMKRKANDTSQADTSCRSCNLEKLMIFLLLLLGPIVFAIWVTKDLCYKYKASLCRKKKKYKPVPTDSD